MNALWGRNSFVCRGLTVPTKLQWHAATNSVYSLWGLGAWAMLSYVTWPHSHGLGWPDVSWSWKALVRISKETVFCSAYLSAQSRLAQARSCGDDRRARAVNPPEWGLLKLQSASHLLNPRGQSKSHGQAKSQVGGPSTVTGKSLWMRKGKINLLQCSLRQHIY